MRGQERIKNCSTVSADPLIGCHPKQLAGAANATNGDTPDLQPGLKDVGMARLEVVTSYTTMFGLRLITKQ